VFDSRILHNSSARAFVATLTLAGSAREQSPRGGRGDCSPALAGGARVVGSRYARTARATRPSSQWRTDFQSL